MYANPLLLTRECSEADTEPNEGIKGDPSLVGIATIYDTKGLRAQVVAEGHECLLKLARLHCAGAISIVCHESTLE